MERGVRLGELTLVVDGRRNLHGDGDELEHADPVIESALRARDQGVHVEQNRSYVSLPCTIDAVLKLARPSTNGERTIDAVASRRFLGGPVAVGLNFRRQTLLFDVSVEAFLQKGVDVQAAAGGRWRVKIALGAIDDVVVTCPGDAVLVQEVLDAFRRSPHRMPRPALSIDVLDGRKATGLHHRCVAI